MQFINFSKPALLNIHPVSAALRDVSAAPCDMLATQGTHGNSRGLEGPWGGVVVTIHEKFLWPRIA